MRVVFLGNSRNVFSERFYGALCETDCQIVAVVDVPLAAAGSTNPSSDTTVMDYMSEARKRGMVALAPDKPNRPNVVERIRSVRPDLLFAVGYTKLLKAELLTTPSVVAANVHASLLPAYRGKHPAFWALRHGEHNSGLTIHAMDAKLDTGNILYQVQVPTQPDDSVATLYERIILRGLPLVSQLISDAQQGTLPCLPQSEEGASYFSGTTEEDFRIDWSQPAEEIRRWIATTPGQCFADISGKRVFFWDAHCVPNHGVTQNGQVLEIGEVECTITTSAGAVQLSKIHVESHQPSPLAAFCRRHGIGVGHSLEP